jgi:hypothetical protein
MVDTSHNEPHRSVCGRQRAPPCATQAQLYTKINRLTSNVDARYACRLRTSERVGASGELVELCARLDGLRRRLCLDLSAHRAKSMSAMKRVRTGNEAAAYVRDALRKRLRVRLFALQRLRQRRDRRRLHNLGLFNKNADSRWPTNKSRYLSADSRQLIDELGVGRRDTGALRRNETKRIKTTNDSQYVSKRTLDATTTAYEFGTLGIELLDTTRVFGDRMLELRLLRSV